ncbi:hypothetical protein B0H14DRAFT_2638800 [Mycena olivaceomarginata]|nr:hypothetical protein B0H14DRAFT_2638800 [Mycena olivaceomarginata]
MAFYAGQGEIRPPFADPCESYLSYEVLIEEQICLFIFHNLRMNDPNQDVTVHPLGYPEFAKVFNDFDESMFKFAYHDIFENWTFWDEKAKIASLKDFLVRDQDLERAGSALRRPFGIARRDVRRGCVFAKEKKEGKNQPISLFQQVVDPANRAAIGERGAKMQADYNARKRAAFHGNKGKASILGTSGGSAASTPNSSAAFEDGEVPEEPPATPSDAGGPSGSGGASSSGTSGDSSFATLGFSCAGTRPYLASITVMTIFTGHAEFRSLSATTESDTAVASAWRWR